LFLFLFFLHPSTKYTPTLNRHPLNIAKIPFTRYDGKMSLKEKEDSLEEFRTEPKCRVMLMSLKCGGLGLNLTCASRVIITDPWFSLYFTLLYLTF